jgi:beta-xylosidase
LSVLLIATLACSFSSPAAPTALALPPTPDFAPQPLPVEPPASAGGSAPAAPFRDDFDGTPAAGWQWIGEDTGTWSLTSAPGYMRLPAGNSDIKGGSPRNLLVLPAPQGSFEITTSVRFTPTAAFQIAGLLIYDSPGNALQFGPAYSTCPGTFDGQCVYFDNYQGGQIVQPNFGTDVGGLLLSYLKLRRSGGSYTAYFSLDGSNWQEIGTHQSSLVPQYVGLIAAQGYQAQESADFDYFTLQPLP